MFDFTLPEDKLSHIVERIYEIDIPRASTFAENRVIPMHTGTITFVLKGNPRVKCNNGIQLVPDYLFSGQYYPTFSFDSDIPSLHYGIALRPTASYKLFNIYPARVKNDLINLADLIGDEADCVRNKLLQVDSTEDRYSILNDFLLQKLPVSNKYAPFDALVDFIYQKKGVLKVADLCEHANVSRRYLEKKFKKIIGLTPGQFVRQVRFHFACTEIAEGNYPVNDILVKFGYYDRSHFMKKFKKFYGRDLSVLTGDKKNLFKTVFSQIMRNDTETNYHP